MTMFHKLYSVKFLKKFGKAAISVFNTKKDLLYSLLDDSDYGKEETDINAELPL